ncbi:hypothetical protein D9M68_621950 [compost metagenome]
MICSKPLADAVVLGGVTGSHAQWQLAPGSVQGVQYLFGDAGGIEEIHQVTVLAMSNDFTYRGGIGADQQATATHGLKHRPGQHEGISQINVCGGNLQDLEVGGVRQPAEEVHARRVDRHLLEHAGSPVRRTFRRAPVANLVAADYHHLRVRVSSKYPRDRTHENMEAPVGLQVTRHVGHHRLASFQFISIRQLQTRLEIGPQVVQRYAFMGDADLVVECLGMETVLPTGR